MEIEDWETIDEFQLNSQVDKLRKEQKQQKEQENCNLQNGDISDDGFRPKILQRNPENQKITILKRPNSGSNLAASNSQFANSSSDKPKHLKTLEQREKEYAEARLRILGSASADTSEEQMKNIMKPNSLSPNTSFSSPQAIIKNPENVIRAPRGPDGTIGFKERR